MPPSSNKQVAWILWVPMVILFLLTTAETAKAQQCSEVLQGLYNVSKTSKEEDMVTSYLKWLTHKEIKSEQDAKNFSLDLNIVLPFDVPIPAEARGAFGSSASSSWGKDLTDYLKSNAAARTKFYQEFLQVNNSVVEAWRDCARNKKGLICWAEQTENPDEVLFHIEVRLVSAIFKPLTINEVQASQHISYDPYHVYRTIGLERELLLTRVGKNKNNAGSFIISTDNVDYQCAAKIPLIPTSVALPAPVGSWRVYQDGVKLDPIQSANSILGANRGSRPGTYLRDVYVIKGSGITEVSLHVDGIAQIGGGAFSTGPFKVVKYSGTEPEIEFSADSPAYSSPIGELISGKFDPEGRGGSGTIYLLARDNLGRAFRFNLAKGKWGVERVKGLSLWRNHVEYIVE